MILPDIFSTLSECYTSDRKLIEDTWKKIRDGYTLPGRYYHTLNHLDFLYNELSAIKHQFSDYDTALFSMFYHDIVYDVTRNDNEEQSATAAEKDLRLLSVPEDNISICKAQILATQSHEVSPEQDTNLFTDADLAILGQKWEVYAEYAHNVRREYAIYPDEMYARGRTAVLNHFLQMPFIFKTSYFRDKYEGQASENIKQEIAQMHKFAISSPPL